MGMREGRKVVGGLGVERGALKGCQSALTILACARHHKHVPLIIIHALRIVVLQLDNAATDAGHQVQMAVRQLQGQKVRPAAGVVQKQPGGLARSKGQAQAQVQVSAHLRQAEKSGPAGKCQHGGGRSGRLFRQNAGAFPASGKRTLIGAVGGEILSGALRARQQLIPVKFENVEAVDDDLAEVAGKVGVAPGACLTCNILYHMGDSDHTEKTKYRNFKTNIPRKEISGPQSQFPHSFVREWFTYSYDQSAYSAGGNMQTYPGTI